MNKEEQEARELCAWACWVKECRDCPHRVWPEGKWLKVPAFDYKECQEWKQYLSRFKIPFLHRLREYVRALISHV